MLRICWEEVVIGEAEGADKETAVVLQLGGRAVMEGGCNS